MNIPEADRAFLSERGITYSVATESNMTCVIISSYQLPQGYNTENADLLLRLNPGYPDVPPDMWWFDPPILLADGRVVRATEVRESYLGRTWQRWSRHFSAGQWKSGIDSLQSFLALIQKELQQCRVQPAG